MPKLLPSQFRSVRWFLSVALMTAMTFASSAKAQPLVSNQSATRLGLTRAWFAQVEVDAARHRVVHWLLDNDRVFALTSAGTLQAIDSATGETLWITELGVGHAPAAGIAVNSDFIVMLGAARLYIMDRMDGHHIWSRPIGGAPNSAPAVSNNYAYVALVNGRVEGYRLDDPSATVWQYQSNGRTFQSPTTTGKVVSWPTSTGHLYVGQAESPKVLFRVETNDEIVAAPAELDPYLYVGSLDGYLYCFHELSGGEQWRYSTGFAITSQPAIVGDKAYVASEGPSLHAVNAITGQLLWRVGGAKQFVALGKQHTYGMDRYGTLIVIDNESGGIAGRLPTGTSNSAIVNDKSDRIFIVNDRGLVQCLHEIGADEPTWHRAKPAESADGEAEPEAAAGQDGEDLGEDPLDAPAGDEFGLEPEAESEPEASEPEEDDNPFEF